jgi:hypothetical protein
VSDIAAAPAQPRWFLRDLVTILVRGEETDGRVDMLETTKPPGDEPPLHVHHDQVEAFYVLEGEVTLFLPAREQRTLRAGRCARAAEPGRSADPGAGRAPDRGRRRARHRDPRASRHPPLSRDRPR